MSGKWGEYCNILGVTPRNRIIELFLCGPESDLSTGCVADMTGLNRATTYNTMEVLIKKEYILPTRKMGGSQLYKLNRDKKEVKFLLKVMDLILDKIAEEVEEEYSKPKKKVSIKH